MMTEQPFVDYYEILQLSPNATADTVERVYRLLAKRLHPDNQETGNAERFAQLLDAFTVLSDPERRAKYDIRYDEHRSVQWKIFDQESAAGGQEADQQTFHGVLSLLYVARRRNPRSGGLGQIQIERLLGVPEQHLEFPLWYLRQHGWIEVLDSGQLAITVEGIDYLGTRELTLPANRLLGPSPILDGSEGAPVDSGARTLDTPASAEPGPDTDGS
jgi:curved DNA-binding protein